MSTRGIIILSLIVLLALPAIWFVLKVAGVPTPATDGFFRDFWPFVIGFVISVGGSILINKYKKR